MANPEVVVSLGEQPSESTLLQLEATTHRIELRADLLPVEVVDRLGARFGARTLYTLRREAEGGAWQGDVEERRRLIERAVAAGWWIDLEIDSDLDEFSELVPAERRVLSWHGSYPGQAALSRTLGRMREVGAAVYKLVPTATTQLQAMETFSWMVEQSGPVVAFAAGVVGSWTRILAARWGRKWAYLAVGAATAPGQIGYRRWFEDGYGDDAAQPGALFGVLGDPVQHSLSPRIHNCAYRELGLDYLYVPFETPDFADFWLDVAESEDWRDSGGDLRGFSVTAPHKHIALTVAGAASPLARSAGVANTLVRRRGVWEAELTDPEGVLLPLRQRNLRLDGARCAVVGAGGAGRAAITALSQAGGEVAVVNRSAERGLKVAERFRIPFVPLAEFDPAGFEVVVNTTSIGRSASEPLPFDPDRIDADGCIIDMVYDGDGAGGETELIRRARERGITAVGGREVLLAQAILQFRMMTGSDLPLAPVRQALGLPIDRLAS